MSVHVEPDGSSMPLDDIDFQELGDGKFMDHVCLICGATLVRTQDSYGYTLSCPDDSCEGSRQYLSERYLLALTFSHAPTDVTVLREALEAVNRHLTGIEINMSNYDYDDVVRLNDGACEACLITHAALLRSESREEELR